MKSDYIIFMAFFCLEHCCFFNTVLSGLKKRLLFSLSKTHNNLIDYTFVNRNKTFICLLPNLSRIQKLLLNILTYVNIIMYIDSITVYIPYNWKHWLHNHSFDWNVIFENNVHKFRYDQISFKKLRLALLSHYRVQMNRKGDFLASPGNLRYFETWKREQFTGLYKYLS